MRSVARPCPDKILAPLHHRRRVAGLCMLRNAYYKSIHCFCGELSSAFHRVKHTHAAVTAHRYELDVLRCRTSQCARCFLTAYVRAWNGLPDVRVWFVRRLQGSCQPLVAFLRCFLSFFCGVGACGVIAICKIIRQFVK